MSKLPQRPVSIMNDAELVDALLDNTDDLLAYQLAYRVNNLNIIYRSGNNKGLFFSTEDLAKINDKDAEELQSEIDDLRGEVCSLESKLEKLDLDQLILGVKNAKKVIQETHQKVDYLLDLGGDQ